MNVDGIAGAVDLVFDAWSVVGGGQAQLGPCVVSKAVDASSSALLSRFASGTDQVTIALLRPGSESVYTTCVLTDAVVSSFAVVGSGRPLERIGFDAAKIRSSTPVAGGPPIQTCFDRIANAVC